MSDFIDGFRILFSREFWRDFKQYWSPEQIAVRLDAYADWLNERSGKR